MSTDLKQTLLNAYRWCSVLLLDPRRLLAAWRALPVFFTNFLKYNRLTGKRLGTLALWKHARFTTFEKYLSAGSIRTHYFWQDLWAARKIVECNCKEHVDVGSRLDGFIAHLLPFCQVTYVDIRPLDEKVDGLRFIQGSILALPFASNSIKSLSCLHVIEHIGLGRYGDEIDPDGAAKAALELERVLATDGRLLLGTPVGRETICFDAHRVFSPSTIVQLFSGLQLKQFSLIDDKADRIIENASFEQADGCHYGCGLFVFTKA